ncbi:MAG: hypothetical protein AB7Q00_14735 [Phycisphaerales bacterium]
MITAGDYAQITNLLDHSYAKGMNYQVQIVSAFITSNGICVVFDCMAANSFELSCQRLSFFQRTKAGTLREHTGILV